MKKMIAMTLALIMALSLFAGCGATKPAETDPPKEVLKVGISPDFAPMEFVVITDGESKISGFDVMLAEYIAQEMGKELQLMPMDFYACQTAVAMGTVDMSISGFSWTEERAANYNLSDYYYAGDNETEQVLITTKDNAGKFTTVESMAGLKVGAQAASLQEGLCKEQLPNTELVVFTDINTGILQLKKGNDELTAEVNKILAKALEAGKYGEWYAAAEELAGIGQEISYDENGNPIVPTTEAAG